MKLLRALVLGLHVILVLPFVWGAKLCGRLSGKDRMCFDMMAETLALAPLPPGIWLRRLFYERTLARCGTRLMMRLGSSIAYPGTQIGVNVYIGRFNSIGLAIIGDDVMIADHSAILSSGDVHLTTRTDIPMRLQGQQIEPTRIGSDVWIGTHALVMNHVGDHSIIGAGSVVVHEIPPYSVAVGNPAKVIKNRLDDPPSAPPL